MLERERKINFMVKAHLYDAEHGIAKSQKWIEKNAEIVNLLQANSNVFPLVDITNRTDTFIRIGRMIDALVVEDRMKLEVMVEKYGFITSISQMETYFKKYYLDSFFDWGKEQDNKGKHLTARSVRCIRKYVDYCDQHNLGYGVQILDEPPFQEMVDRFEKAIYQNSFYLGTMFGL